MVLLPPRAGHCPHDDLPVAANAALASWLRQLPPPAAPLSAIAARMRSQQPVLVP